MSYKLQAAVGVAVAGFVNASLAADDVYRLDDVVVTASRTAQTVDQALAPVTVITREEIERSQASSVTELLQRTPGLQIATNGGPGSKAGVMLRGTRTAQTLVLIDGHRFNSPNGNEAPLEYIDPDQIERIEIVRGPRSSLYGADAVGGVIQIFTRKGTGKPRFQVKAGAGSRGTSELGLNYGGEVDGTRFDISGKFFETAGYDHTDSTLGRDGDDDGYRNKSIAASVSRVFNDAFEAGASVSHFQGKSEYDHNSAWGNTNTKPYSDFELTNISTFANANILEDWSAAFNLGYSYENIKRFEEGGNPKPVVTSYGKSKRYTGSWLNDIGWSDNQLLTAGIDYSKEHMDSSSNYAVDSRYNVGVFAQNHTTFDGSDLQLGLRRDKNEVYGYNTTGNIAWGVDLSSNHRLITSYGTAFRAPTFLDLYYPGAEAPNLKPESSENFEVELKGKVNHTTNWSVSIYQNEIDDLLVWNNDLGSFGRMDNVDKARIRGVEFVYVTEWQGWLINSNLTFVDPEDLKAKRTLDRRAKQLFNVNADKQFGKYSLGSTLRAQGHSYEYNDFAGTVNRLSGFATVDLRAGMQVSKELKAEIKLTNLMDKDYSTALGYRGEPRGMFVTFIWSPEI